MAREDIESMIASALEGIEERPRPLPHAQHILDPYAALVRDEERAPEPGARIAVPIATATEANLARKVLARLWRPGK